MTGALVGLGIGIGLLLIWRGWSLTRRPKLEDRVVPYLRDITTVPQTVQVSGQDFGNVVNELLARVAHWVGNVLGGSASVHLRLDRLGRAETLEQFRTRQLIWGFCGFGLCAAFSLVWFAAIGASPVALLVFCLVGFVVGLFACDNSLATAVRKYEQRMSEQFPTVADLLALAVAAGEGPVAGLERVVRVSNGELSTELSRVLSDVRTGTSVPRAFDRLAARTGVSGIARFAEGLSVAVERGTPLVDVLHAQAADVRETGRRELIESGGRKEVAMMIPVVFLVLPITIVFAFFPGYVSLHLTSGM